MRRTPVFAYLISAFLLLFSASRVTSQVTLAFQGGEPGDTWGYTSSGASAIAQAEVASPQNRVSGNASLVAGGNTGGGNCWAGGSGNGPSVARQFMFDAVDISSSNESQRTLAFYWGNRQPVCNGTGWDSGENLTFTAYHDGVAQGTVTLVTGSNNASFPIDNNQYTWTIPPCVNQFHFVVGVTTNRSDELLFIDDAQLTAPQLNTSSGQPSPIAGNTSVCGGTEVYGVLPVAGAIYTWSGLPAGASFTTPNATAASHTITVDWGTAAAGTYTLTVTPSNACGAAGTPQTIDVTVGGSGAPVTISGPVTICPGETVVLSSGYATGNTWSPNGETTQTISIAAPGTYEVTVDTGCGTVTDDHTVSYGPVPDIQSVAATDVSCFGMTDGALTVNAAAAAPQYSLDGVSWQSANVFTGLAPGTYEVYVREAGGCQVSVGAAVSAAQELVAGIANDGPVCQGNAAGLHGTTTSSGVAWNWTGPGGYTSSAQDPADATLPGTYSLFVSQNGCVSPAVSTQVTVNALPQVAASNTGPYCAGDAVQLEGTFDTNASWEWTGPNGYHSAAEDPSDATESGVYTLTVTQNGCTAGVSTVATVFPLPEASIAAQVVCMPNPVSFQGSAIAVHPQQVTAWHWDFGDGETSDDQHPGHVYGQSGSYSVTLGVATNMGCTTSVTQPLTIGDAPQASFQLSPDVISGLDPTVYFTNMSTGADHYLWEMGGDLGSTAEQSPVIPFPATESFYVVTLIAYAPNGCTDTIRKTIPVEHDVVYYVPNAFTPDGDEYNNTFRPVFTEGHDPDNYVLAVYNRWGEVIFESHDVGTGWDGTYHGNLSQEGTYVWNIRFKHRADDGWEQLSGHVSLIR